jgi:2-oxoglutarate ferredoxin oxidoreductase subunit alpha
MRLRAFPFNEDVARFIDSHERIFVVEQNRDAQMRTLLVNDLDCDPKKLVKILHFGGAPITARFIAAEIGSHLEGSKPSRRLEAFA